MHLWTEEGHEKIDWVPYVFIDDPLNGNTKNLNGDKVSKKTFDSYNEYYSFQKDNYSLYENKVRPEIQFLTERYYETPDEDIPTPKLLIYYLDIEVNYEQEFPKPSLAKYPICLISIRNSVTEKTVTFGEKEYTGDMKEDVTYVHCPDESELLRKFFTYMANNAPDVISGWNVDKFDLAYLINRDKKINAGKYFNLLSPINMVKTWQSKDGGVNIDIAGITIVDYMFLYKWYSPNNLESYKLDFVSNFELDVGKLDYSEAAVDLRELYQNDWNTYVDYNIIDCKRVNELGRKLGYIRLVQAFSLLTKVPMKYYDKATQLVEGLMLVHARRNDLCVPRLVGGSQETFEAAWVKEPQKGKHSWLFSVDIASSYPSHIIVMNMSVETYFGRILGIHEGGIMQYLKNGEDLPEFGLSKGDGEGPEMMKGNKLKSFNIAIKKGLFSVAPCGTVFINNKPGIISTVERTVFFKRKQIKGMMKEAKGEERERLFAFQWALKILLNSVYGAMAVPYSRYYNQDIAEAITSGGRYTIRSSEKFANEIMNNPDEGFLKIIEGIKEKY